MASSQQMTGNLTCSLVGYDNVTSSWVEDLRLTGKDASWILTTAVIIFTMQTGFGLLEAGFVSAKCEVNIMMKNALDVVFGGITYWAFGFGLSFGSGPGSNAFVGTGCFFVDADDHNMGHVFAMFLFQLSFATTATTIVSGAMTERTRLSAYIVFSLLNTFIYSIPARWIWSDVGFLYQLGAIDVAGCGPVHVVGGTTGLIATLVLKPRLRAFSSKNKPIPPSPLKAILGMFMLWWGWLRFSSGSVFIMSDDTQWKVAVRAGVTTIVSSMAGGIMGVLISRIRHGICKRGAKYDIGIIISAVLASLVSVTGICTLCKTWEALLIGTLGAGMASLTEELLYKYRVDDPVNIIPVHGVCGIWGMLSVGLFLEPKNSHVQGLGGLFKGGGWYLLGVQALTCTTIAAWTSVGSFILLKVIDLTIGLRLSPTEEELGVDLVEHAISPFNIAQNSNIDLDMILRVLQESDILWKVKNFNHIGSLPSKESLNKALSKNDINLTYSRDDIRRAFSEENTFATNVM